MVRLGDVLLIGIVVVGGYFVLKNKAFGLSGAGSGGLFSNLLKTGSITGHQPHLVTDSTPDLGNLIEGNPTSNPQNNASECAGFKSSPTIYNQCINSGKVGYRYSYPSMAYYTRGIGSRITIT